MFCDICKKYNDTDLFFLANNEYFCEACFEDKLDKNDIKNELTPCDLCEKEITALMEFFCKSNLRGPFKIQRDSCFICTTRINYMMGTQVELRPFVIHKKSELEISLKKNTISTNERII